ncbi:MAG: pinensin family lanthipeptide [Bacteroidota bacterium]
MKKKMKLENLAISSFTTQLKDEKAQTAKGGATVQICVSGPFVMCFSFDKFISCDCDTLDPREFGCPVG